MSVKLNRRTMLRGLGAGVGLPLLEAMYPTTALAVSRTAAAPVRSAFVFFPNGAIMDRWKPQGEGKDFRFGETLSCLETYREDILMTTGLTQHHARANGDGAGDHARNSSAFLTGAQPRKTSGADIEVGVSIDQAIAKDVGHLTRLPSLELGIERGRNAGSCDSGYSCAYSANISWKSESVPTAKEINPKLAFERLFGNPGDARSQERRNKFRKSILDFVAEDARRLRQEVGGTDRQKLDEYFTSIREIEQRIDRANHMAKIKPPEMDLPEGVPSDLDEHIRLMYDILVVAFQADATRISSFMLANAGSNRTYPEVEVRDGHHELSHHRNDEGKMEQISRIDRYLAERFGYFLGRLKSVREGEGTLLDNSMIVYGSAISDGNRHQHHDLPVLVAGKGGGIIETGRYVAYPEETPLNNLFLTMAGQMGSDLASLGNSTGPLTVSS